MRRRLVGEIVNLAKEPIQASTGTAEVYDVIVKVVEDKITSSTTVITKSKWSSVKALFGKEKGNHETELDEELRLLYQFIYGSSPIEKKSPISPVNTHPNPKSPNEMPLNEKPSSKDRFPTPSSPIADPNVCSSQEVSSLMYGLNDREIEEIEQAFKVFERVLNTPAKEQLKVLLDGTILVNMVDTGGQPAFLEMLPALTISPALYLIFLSALD